MTAPSTNPTNANAGLGPGVFCANTSKHEVDHSAEKTLSTIRAKLCMRGGQRLHVAEDGLYFVSNPFGQITKFDTVEALQAYIAKVGA